MSDHSPWALSRSDSEAYERFRPRYPEALFEFLGGLVERHERAWDCGAGSGQVSERLRRHFRTTIATDRSIHQLRAGPPLANVHRVACTAHHVALGAGTVDLVAIGQALHWFATPEFFDEVRRIARHGSAISAWTYRLVSIAPSIDRLIADFHERVIRPYWPPERIHVDQAYRTISFPFERIPTPSFSISTRWSLHHMIGYVRTWSAARRARAETGQDPVAPLADELESLWGPPDTLRDIIWPLTVLAGRIG